MDWWGLFWIIVLLGVLGAGRWLIDVIKAWRGDPKEKAELELRTAEENRKAEEARLRRVELEQNGRAPTPNPEKE